MSTKPKFRVESCSTTQSPFDPHACNVKAQLVGFFPKEDADSIRQMLLNRSFTVEQLRGDALIGDAAAEIDVEILKAENEELKKKLFYEHHMNKELYAKNKELKDRLAAQWQPGVE
jgi:hypothetical protein